MPPVDVPALLLEDETRGSHRPSTVFFAQPIPVNVTPLDYGTWENLSDGTSIWRLRVRSEKALSLNSGFTQHPMPERWATCSYIPQTEAGLSVRSLRRIMKPMGQLWTPILLSNEVVIEVTLPTDKVGELVLTLTSVNHGYAAFGRTHTITSGACNVDVVCPEWGRMAGTDSLSGGDFTGGSTFCTGFLVNNTAQDLKGYFMTANHCGSHQARPRHWSLIGTTKTPGADRSMTRSMVNPAMAC